MMEKNIVVIGNLPDDLDTLARGTRVLIVNGVLYHKSTAATLFTPKTP